ncbi:putative ThiF family protein [uncultured Desulfobacterium sp.]|uniref:Putative ThiF family protein n=1 Tax=uncultured Desulfobacterium sp. TaxID=201089 RepID=A0A445MRE3_9BACT|nr:putative ThiF family protein [uncultured Desulfobacterium sp.]
MIFDRQIAFWGEERQSLLTNASIFVAGVGGLGCLLSEILVRSGVGRLYLCDRGEVDETDLNRQLFYTQHDIGKKKLDVAVDWLSSIHKYTDVVPVTGDIMEEDFSLPEDINGVADCLDNFESRFCLWTQLNEGMFYVHAGVEQFFGQVITLIKGDSAGLKEILANYEDSKRTIPISANSASTVSSLAATEVLNNIFGDPKLLNKLLIIDLSNFTFSKVEIRVNQPDEP